jgi:sec-independent protein translocase protein TatB
VAETGVEAKVFGIGGWEIFVIVLVALVVLGPKGLPSAARAVGRLFSELRRATSDLRQSIELDPELRELPRALDELNRPLLSPGPFSTSSRPKPRKRIRRDQPESDDPPYDPPRDEEDRPDRAEADARPEEPSPDATPEPEEEREE